MTLKNEKSDIDGHWSLSSFYNLLQCLVNIVLRLTNPLTNKKDLQCLFSLYVCLCHNFSISKAIQ